MCSGASSRGSLLWYRWTSEKWHASMFRKPDMTAGYLVSLLHRCTIALGKKRHQSYSSARRQRRIISGKVFTASLKKKNGSRAKKKCILGKAQKSLFLQRKFTARVCSGAWAGAVPGSQGWPSQGAERAGSPPQRPSASAGNQRRSETSLPFPSPPVKQTLCNQQHGYRYQYIHSRKPGGVRGCADLAGAAGALPPAGCTAVAPSLQHLCAPNPAAAGLAMLTNPQRSGILVTHKKQEGKFVPGTGTCQRMNERCPCPWAALKGCHWQW